MLPFSAVVWNSGLAQSSGTTAVSHDQRTTHILFSGLRLSKAGFTHFDSSAQSKEEKEVAMAPKHIWGSDYIWSYFSIPTIYADISL